ncbi:putative septum site-determining protein MinC [Insulibacter thermoxylanivorax]|uniref:Probable septum site-determining protein MinC n=1 Tax=Insulibacter thermoxylanivorax TaxID=2749268 RepID=A0A916QG89_9BACL|nr:septum site-determining protein MinC [Insulibacter thermoxylanivorax]GFR39104.1 putative septum site-determining protein MinC [Insulibacter thermoxylanivorax]
MTGKQQHVTIKGRKDGLVFVLDDRCPFSELLSELEYKLENSHSKLLSGPLVHVHVRLGQRQITEAEKDTLHNLINRRNLVVQSIESDVPQESAHRHKVLTGIVRSGQVLRHEGNLIFIGDVNPGGSIIATGDIFILGSLRGMAHAGEGNNPAAVIAASHFKPTQLRIADAISRPPDEWGIDDTMMMFAYMKDERMEIEKITHLYRFRPDAVEIYKGE